MGFLEVVEGNDLEVDDHPDLHVGILVGQEGYDEDLVVGEGGGMEET